MLPLMLSFLFFVPMCNAPLSNAANDQIAVMEDGRWEGHGLVVVVVVGEIDSFFFNY